MPGKYVFELAFRESRKLSSFIKTCEAMCVQSDTALFKVKPRGVYIMLTDFESLCCLETRVTDNIGGMFKMNCPEFTSKILLDSLTSILRKIMKNKHSAILCADEENSRQLKVREVLGQTYRLVAEHIVASTEHRARVYQIMSTNRFQRLSQNFVKFRIPNIEFNKIVTMQSIISGTHGGVGEITITPIPDEEDAHCLLPKNRVSIKFFLQNSSGDRGNLTIHTHPLAETVPILHRPEETIRCQYFLTYLKRSQNLLSVPSDSVTVYVSNKGIMLQTDYKDHHSTVVYTADISDEDLQSYV